MAQTFPNTGPFVFDDSADALTTVYSREQYPLGTFRNENGKRYKFVKYDDGAGNLNAVAGSLVYYKDNTLVVTRDVSDTDRNLVAGVAMAAATDGKFLWMQTWGRHATVKTDGGDDIVKGDAVIAHATADGDVDRAAQDTAPPNRVVGWALADDTATTVDTFLVLE
jgi:hypothetical protein